MKKIILLVVTVLVFYQGVYGQAKQRKELFLQIAALQVYIDYAKKGYSVVSKGLDFIGDVKKGEVSLHGDYFASLLKINPKVRSYYKTAGIISLQLQIMKICRKTLSGLQGGDLFYGDELDHIERSFGRLLSSCSDTLEELLIVTSDSKLGLTDDQRIERIDALYKAMLEDYEFCISFSRQAEGVLGAKAREMKDTQAVKGLYGL